MTELDKARQDAARALLIATGEQLARAVVVRLCTKFAGATIEKFYDKCGLNGKAAREVYETKWKEGLPLLRDGYAPPPELEPEPEPEPGENEYTCSICGKTFDAGRTNDEALHEFNERFPDFDPTDVAPACENCAQKFYAWEAELDPAEVERMRLEREPGHGLDELYRGFEAGQ